MEPDSGKIISVVEFLHRQPARRVPATVLNGIGDFCGTIACHTGWLGYILYTGGYRSDPSLYEIPSAPGSFDNFNYSSRGRNPLYHWDLMVNHFNWAILPDGSNLESFNLVEWFQENRAPVPAASLSGRCMPHIYSCCADINVLSSNIPRGWRYGAESDCYPAINGGNLLNHYLSILDFWRSLAIAMAPGVPIADTSPVAAPGVMIPEPLKPLPPLPTSIRKIRVIR